MLCFTFRGVVGIFNWYGVTFVVQVFKVPHEKLLLLFAWEQLIASCLVVPVRKHALCLRVGDRDKGIQGLMADFRPPIYLALTKSLGLGKKSFEPHLSYLCKVCIKFLSLFFEKRPMLLYKCRKTKCFIRRE